MSDGLERRRASTVPADTQQCGIWNQFYSIGHSRSPHGSNIEDKSYNAPRQWLITRAVALSRPHTMRTTTNWDKLLSTHEYSGRVSSTIIQIKKWMEKKPARSTFLLEHASKVTQGLLFIVPKVGLNLQAAFEWKMKHEIHRNICACRFLHQGPNAVTFVLTLIAQHTLTTNYTRRGGGVLSSCCCV